MTRIDRWWRERSPAERFDLTTRWSLYLVLALPLLIATSTVSSPRSGQEVRPAVGGVLVVVGVCQGVTCAFLANAAIDRYLGRPARLSRLVALAVGLTVAGSVAGFLVVTGPEAPGDTPVGVVLALAFTGMLAAALSPALRPTTTVVLVAATVAGGAVAGALAGGSGAAVQAAVFALIWVSFMTATYKFSAWMVGVVWELDRGRDVAARLAVAEERLRFSRDLHDVLGRNLSVIAVKSELAARLAERGEAGAAAEMVEVRRVAHESLREVRDVVRGYRTADLGVELAGARSVLRSAGVECRVIGDGTHLPEEVQTALGWVVREATTNVIRHSDATTCTIGLDVRSDGGTPTAVLRMENDRARPDGATRVDGAASGADGADGADGAGSGLAGLSERLAGVGGRLTAERRRGDRFVVEASVPVAS
jgi:two-component system sensor histidine kinase DesK